MNTSTARRWFTLSIVVASFVLLAACGPDSSDNGDGGGADATPDTTADSAVPDTSPDTGPDTGQPPPDTMADTIADTGGDAASDTGTGDSGPAPDGMDGGGSTLALVTSTTDKSASPSTSTVRTTLDFSSGSVADSKTYTTGDLVLDKSAGRVFVLNRRCSGPGGSGNCPASAGVAVELSLAKDGSISEFRSMDLPSGVYNPQGVGVTASATTKRTFVTSYVSSKIYKYNSAGSRTGKIDVAPFDKGSTSGDNDPEPTDVAIDGKYAYFTLLRLSGFMPKNSSAVVGYDVSSGSLIDFDSNASGTQALDLQTKNAKAGMAQGPNGKWAVGSRAKFGKKDGAITRLTKQANGRLSVGSTLVGEQKLGGDLQTFVLTGSKTGVAIVLLGSGDTRAVKFDASGGSVTTTKLKDLNGFSTALCMSPDRSEVWVGVRKMPQSKPGKTKFVGFDPAAGSQLSKTGPNVSGALPSCQVLEIGN